MPGFRKYGFSLRARALQKLCEINSKETAPLEKLINSLPISYSSNTSKLYSIPLTSNEFEIILAISDMVPHDLATATSIIESFITPYFVHCSKQRFTDIVLNKFKINGFKNPLEILSYKMTLFLIVTNVKFPSLTNKVEELFCLYLENLKEPLSVTGLISFVGMLKAVRDGISKINTITDFHWTLTSVLMKHIDANFLMGTKEILSQSISNDFLVNYFEYNREICPMTFVSLLGKIRSALLKTLFGLGREKRISEYLLEIQDLEFQEKTAEPRYLDFVRILNDNEGKIRRLCLHSEKVINDLDNGVEYLDLQTYNVIAAAYSSKVVSMEILAFSLFLEETVSSMLSENLTSIILQELSTLQTVVVIDSVELLRSVITIGSLLNFFTNKVSTQLLTVFPSIVSSCQTASEFVGEISNSFALGLKSLPEDSVVGTIYSLNNLLAVTKDGSPVPLVKERNLTFSNGEAFDKSYSSKRRSKTFNSLSSMRKIFHGFDSESNSSSSIRVEKPLDFGGHMIIENPNASYHTYLFKNAVTACVEIAKHYGDQSIVALAITILTQKYRALSPDSDKIILEGLANLLPQVSDSEFTMLCKFYNNISIQALKENNEELISSIQLARSVISRQLKQDTSSAYYIQYLRSILETIVSRGDVETLEHHRSHHEISAVAEQISFFLKPLAQLLPAPGKELSISSILDTDATTTTMFRSLWFNMVIHGFFDKSDLARENQEELKIIAYNSPPLASDFPFINQETTLEMNTILRRGSSNHNVKAQKSSIQQILSSNVIASRTISTTKVMFLSATLLLESIRCDVGDCSTVLKYYSDPSIVNSNLDKFIGSIAILITQKYLNLVPVGGSEIFASKQISQQLQKMFLMLSHRDLYLQDCAFQSCDLFIKKLPSSLCHHDSLYCLLDSLTVLFDSVTDFEARKYDPRFEFKLRTSGITLMLSDSEDWRRTTFERLVNVAREWVKILLRTSNQDAKILLQSYIIDATDLRNLNNVDFGVSFALEMAGSILSIDRELSKISHKVGVQPNTLSGFLSHHAYRSKILTEKTTMSSPEDTEAERIELRRQIRKKLSRKEKVEANIITDFLNLCGIPLLLGRGESASLVNDVVSIPFEAFTSDSIKVATNLWLSFIKDRKDLAHLLVSEIATFWCSSIDAGQGLYNRDIKVTSVEFETMEYKPYDFEAIKHSYVDASEKLKPHLQVIRFFSSHFEATLYESDHLLKLFTQVVFHAVSKLSKASLHPFARLVRNELLRFSLLVFSANCKKGTSDTKKLAKEIVSAGLSWFYGSREWPLGSNELKIKADLSLMVEVYNQFKAHSKHLIKEDGNTFVLLEYFMLDEIRMLNVWLKPMEKHGDDVKLPSDLIAHAFKIDCQLALNLCERYPDKKNQEKLQKLIRRNPVAAAHVHSALKYLIQECSSSEKIPHEVVYFAPISPLASINLFLPPWNSNSFLLQYNLAALESHEILKTFFYVPQIVQTLRYDDNRYVERFILDTAKLSTLFSHQIIWNMLANSYQDDEGTVEDPIKPTLDRIRSRMIDHFDSDAKSFYQREFSFFNEVTGISGKLKPYIKKTKAEKKIKIDQEMATIKVEPDVYLPSNPDGVVIDIDRKSGKPLQSHAKAPFMATFKIKRDLADSSSSATEEAWQSAIFKVGDDCRQDVLALQLVSIFRSIWSAIGLDLYVFPYRVTATAPGCGVIDVLPNSISRDMLGREAVNGLYEYFITKFGPENSFSFQNARNNFVKSLAAYSVISYLLQFKDRHNGNIMYDASGHCLHIDFGFIFDIVPGGVKFEAVPFKLTKEMVRVMGGSQDTQAFRQFQNLCVSAYLAARPYMPLIVECVKPMMQSSLPCFKGEKTLRNLRARFVPAKRDYEAAQHMRQLIARSYESMFTRGYDEFQRLTNGIPY